ncbi:MAG: hypothetical protein BWK79_15520 [Beggiatoa sp. IS2]|nr:MAG: hypothetical protein BWK79_15520 [Beggiatoa sp. IS2]
MIELLETIKIIDGKPYFLEYHNNRLNDSRKTLFHCTEKIDLATVIHPPIKRGCYRCRVIYAEALETIEYHPYFERTFKYFQVIEANALTYDFKYVNRESINALGADKGLADDILILKQGIVTDTSMANVAFWQGTQWITPAVPLLKGTTRQRLLDERKIVPQIIKIDDLIHFNKMAIMNALIGFYVIKNFVLVD